MPDKDNDNKFMAMLEKMGMVRKLDSDDEMDEESGGADTRMSSSYDYEEDNFRQSTQADSDDVLSEHYRPPHQPVPGVSDEVVMPPETHHLGNTYDEPEMYDESSIYDEPEHFEEPDPYADAREYAETVQKQAAADTRSYTFEQSFWNEPAQDDKTLPIEAYTDRFLDAEELYGIFSMKTSGTDTVYLIEEYLKTLPDSLPDDSRRDIVIKIIAASGFNYDSLMGDGVARVGKLKEYAEQFAQRTEDYIASRSAELESLERQIQKVRSMIERRRELHKKQFFSIEAEAQRLKDLLSFLSD